MTRGSADNDTLTIKVSVRELLDGRTLVDLIRWLKAEAPPTISELEVENVVFTTKKLHDLVFENVPGEPQPIFDRFSESSQSDVLRSWGPLSSLLSTERGYVPAVGIFETVRQRAETVFQQLRLQNASFCQSIQRNAATLDESGVSQLAENQDAQAVGLSEPLRVRQMVMNAGRPGDELEIDRNAVRVSVGNSGVLPTGRPVVVEYKVYKKEDRMGSYGALYSERIQKLARLLNIPKTANFHTLKCLHWFEDEASSRFGLVFEVPHRYVSRPASLLDVLCSKVKANRPSLGQRFHLAVTLARALEQWHSVDWVHQSICSANVLLFQPEGSKNGNWDYESPFLGGFEYARPNTEPSTPRRVDDFEFNVYRHPNRQGLPIEQFRKEHDIYSFGVLLLEIGLWVPVKRLFTESVRNGNEAIAPHRLRTILLDETNTRLSHYMGDCYRDTVKACLRGDFGVKEDDRIQTRLGMAFHERVIDKLALGVNL